MKPIFVFTLAVAALGFNAKAHADCRPETVIDTQTGAASVKVVCDNGSGSSFTPGGSGGNCRVVVIPGKGSTLLCE